MLCSRQLAHLVVDSSTRNQDIAEAGIQAALPRDSGGFVQQDECALMSQLDAGVPGFGTKRGDQRLVVAGVSGLCDDRARTWPKRRRVGNNALVAVVRTYQEVGSRLITHDHTAHRTSGGSA